ncbi:hypothetical protein PENSPDRAFT_754029 [Peniophora sp. CONT]|nr:hypothetical protein PENSPDRAFT_754029 [Peniophora sp. CONT]
MRHLERALQQAKELYNSDSPICSLPDELLLDIFTRVRDAAAAQALDSDISLPTPSWNESATICRRFRRIIIESPSLHTRLSTATHPAAYIGHALARSDSMPIELDVLKPCRDAEEVGRLYELLQQHGHRVNVLSLKVTEYCVPMISSWLQHLSSMGTLSLYQIKYRDEEMGWERSVLVDDITLDSGAFHPVRLSTLILSHINFVVTDYTSRLRQPHQPLPQRGDFD